MSSYASRSWGPSPRVRGAVDENLGRGGHVGTIPAGAGSRRRGDATVTAGGDHPRGCGEQLTWGNVRSGRSGPSPRVRGAVGHRRAHDLADGTIPAGAGSSARHHRDHRSDWDHPRGCGEQGSIFDQRGVTGGPSPRVRGAVVALVEAAGPVGTIPAGAGSSPRRGTGTGLPGDHPRGCGEQTYSTRPEQSKLGPSPRVRGAASARTSWSSGVGTIPAGAGSRLIDLQVYGRRGVVSATFTDSGK